MDLVNKKDVEKKEWLVRISGSSDVAIGSLNLHKEEKPFIHLSESELKENEEHLQNAIQNGWVEVEPLSLSDKNRQEVESKEQEAPKEKESLLSKVGNKLKGSDG